MHVQEHAGTEASSPLFQPCTRFFNIKTSPKFLRIKILLEKIFPPLGVADFHVTVTICNIAVDPVSSS